MSHQIFLIKDLSRFSEHSVHTLKFYLKIGLIKAAGRSPTNGYRYFNASTLERLAEIRRLKKQNKSLKEIKRCLT